MIGCQLIVRTPEGVWQGEVDSWTALVVLAALSAEPETLAELSAAVRRYQPKHRLFDQAQQASGADASVTGPWCLIDLAGRTVVAAVGVDLPDPRGAYEPDEDEPAEGFPIVWMDTPADWLFQHASADWQKVVADRAAARASVRRVDARAVLFGQPLVEHLAVRVLAVETGPESDEQEREQTRAIHADWLLTPRADLDGRTPREVLLAERHRISWDLERRSEQWCQQQHPPPPLPVSSLAYRLGGFGTTEVVIYFDLVRALLAEAWLLTGGVAWLSQQELVERLAHFRDGWLNEPNPELESVLTPVELIERERRRLPVTNEVSHLDCDCPICRAAADLGPMFMCFDGHHLELEDTFAFSMCETREEWDRQQEDNRQMMEAMDRKAAEREAAGADAEDDLAEPLWQDSDADWDGEADPDTGHGQALLALRSPLAKLVGDLETRSDGQDLLRAVNEAHGDLRRSQEAVARDSAAEELRELLEEVCRQFPDLTSRCADLQSRLDEMLRRLS